MTHPPQKPDEMPKEDVLPDQEPDMAAWIPLNPANVTLDADELAKPVVLLDPPDML